MRLFGFILLVMIMLIDPEGKLVNPKMVVAQEPQTVMCFRKGEVVSGRYKICYYSCLGSTVAITVKSYELCPITIQQ